MRGDGAITAPSPAAVISGEGDGGGRGCIGGEGTTFVASAGAAALPLFPRLSISSDAAVLPLLARLSISIIMRALSLETERGPPAAPTGCCCCEGLAAGGGGRGDDKPVLEVGGTSGRLPKALPPNRWLPNRWLP